MIMEPWVLSHLMAIVLNLLAMLYMGTTVNDRGIQKSKKGRRVTYIVGWSVIALNWFIVMTGMAEEGFVDNGIGFKENV